MFNFGLQQLFLLLREKGFSQRVIAFLISKLKEKIQPNLSKKSPFQVKTCHGKFHPQKGLLKSSNSKKKRAWKSIYCHCSWAISRLRDPIFNCSLLLRVEQQFQGWKSTEISGRDLHNSPNLTRVFKYFITRISTGLNETRLTALGRFNTQGIQVLAFASK